MSRLSTRCRKYLKNKKPIFLIQLDMIGTGLALHNLHVLGSQDVKAPEWILLMARRHESIHAESAHTRKLETAEYLHVYVPNLTS